MKWDWISKLAQTIIGLKFGWPNGIANGERKVIVISGGLTGRIRRKYKLNSLLNPDAKSEEEAETKNRNDDRHHALDAMVISFLPNWARNSRFTGFFKFPDGVHRELFGKEIAEVIPQNVCFEKTALAETIYGARIDDGEKVIVQRAELVSLGMKPTAPGKSVFDLKYAVKQAQSIRDSVIREKLLGFLTSNPDETAWRKFCAEFYLVRKDGSNGSRVEYVTVNVGEPTEYKDLSKDGTGAYRKALKGHKGQIIYSLSTTDKKGAKKEVIAVRPKVIAPKTPRCPTKWSFGSKNRASLPCKAVGSEVSYQLSLPPGSALTSLSTSLTSASVKPILTDAPPGGRQNYRRVFVYSNYSPHSKAVNISHAIHKNPPII